MARGLFHLVSSTMRQAVSAYNAGNESEYIALETIAKETIFFALDRGQVSYKTALDIADACMVII